jgi:hypothetical protein
MVHDERQDYVAHDPDTYHESTLWDTPSVTTRTPPSDSLQGPIYNIDKGVRHDGVRLRTTLRTTSEGLRLLRATDHDLTSRKQVPL